MPPIIPILHAGLVVFLLIIFPLWDRRETARLKAAPSPAARIRSYQKTIVWLWAASGSLLATVPWSVLFTPPVVPGLSPEEASAVSLPILIGVSVAIGLPLLGAVCSPSFLSMQLQ